MRQINRESPTGADLALLMARHTQAMHADTPPESIHMMDATALDSPNIHFFVLRDQGQPVGMGAFKIMNAHEGEIK
ncbi:MAG: GNAT family N-acetyltransferase, partial [Paracoccaceae bacterium]|nr:GNAT family N-acetyltransferase [Paracoccaceae bacterium]